MKQTKSSRLKARTEGATPYDQRMVMDVSETCRHCGGEGKYNIPLIRIDPSVIPYHLKHHAYSPTPGAAHGKYGASEVIGANCDCPRVEDERWMDCRFCEDGSKQRRLIIPVPGDMVRIPSLALIQEVFGKDADKFVKFGEVIDVLEPEHKDNIFTLPTGIAIMITWASRKAKKRTTYAFDLTEIELVW